MKKIAEFISTFFYFGFSPVAPGTIGSIVSLIMIFPLVWYPSIMWCFFAFAFVTVLGFAFIPLYLSGKVDDLQEIVIDEASGLYLSIFIAMLGAKFLNVQINHYITFVFCFIFFRIFDITKPLVIGYADKNLKGAAGIMLDDILAGIFAGITVSILMLLYKYAQ